MDSPDAVDKPPPAEGKLRIGTVVINFNSYDDTKTCIASLLKLKHDGHMIFCIDNFSTDGSHELLAADFPEAVHFRTEANLGFGGGMNAGVVRALESGCDFVFLFNNDAYVDDPNLFEKLLRPFEKNECMGLVSPAEYDITGSTLLFAGATGKREWEMAASGAALFVSRKVFDTVGLLDERFFLGYEDQDLLKRAERKGFHATTVADARFMHKGMANTGRHARMMTYLEARNEIMYYARHWGLRTFLRRVVIGNLKRVPRKALVYPEEGRPELFGALIRGLLRGISYMPKTKRPESVPPFDPSRWIAR
jgi:GT2 family glycosyltransferase